ncbi:MAG: cell division protein FtsZ [Bacteroidia bacterium]|nr:cell division protein FtsZ [Bacteroidia bacterium]
MYFDIPEKENSIIKVIGVGGGGGNAVTHMFKNGIVGVDFAICNTDNQAIESSLIPTRIQLGPQLTEGRGAGSIPTVGREACLESKDHIREFLGDTTKMLFITAGMGGGTGTGAAPIIAEQAKELNILTVGIVTIPFTFEGKRRMKQALDGLEELKKHVDTLIIISNDKLRTIHGNLKLSEAFSQADNVLTTAAKGIAEIITVPGYINVDFEDVNTVMRKSGVSIMGTATVGGEHRARNAVDQALHSPLLEENNINGAKHILLNITSGKKEVTMDEIFEITEFVQEEAGFGTDLIWGNCYDEKLDDEISVTLIATGFDSQTERRYREEKKPERVVLGESPIRDKERQYTPSLKDITEETPAKLEDLELEVEEKDGFPFQQTSLFDRGGDTDATPTINLYEATSNPQNSYDQERRRKIVEDRNQRLAEIEKKKLSNPNNVSDLESQPAYKRRKVKFEEVEESDNESELSDWSFSKDNELDSSRNKFLHDNVD